MLFDTNIFIYADRGNEEARRLFMQTELISISAVTYMEYVPYCRNKQELAAFEKLLTSLRISTLAIDYDISLDACNMVRAYALSHSMEMGDALIAATALKHKVPLCTANVKHFSQIKGLKLERFSP